jgi:hypothetical protein
MFVGFLLDGERSMKRRRSYSRITATLTANLENRLLSYSTAAAAAGVSLLAIVQPSEAKVVFTPTNQTIARNVTYTLDLNNDGIGDFTISNFGNDFDIGIRNTNGSSYTSVFMRAYALGKSNRVWGTLGFQSALAKGVSLSSKGKFNQNGGLMGHVSSHNFGPVYNGPWAPDGATVSNKFVGFKFVISGQVHYGWARFTVRLRNAENGGAGHALLTGYAYETVANKPIVTGQTTGPDVETMPRATLGHLAAGAPRH